MNLNTLQNFSRILPFLLLLSSCGSKGKIKETGATVIHYKVEYMDEMAGNIRTNILPDRMKLVLTDEYAMNSISGFFGQFSLTYVANLKKGKVSTLLKFFDKKYFHTGNKGDLPCSIDPMKGMKFSTTGNEKNLIGFTCDEYLLKLPRGDSLFFYTSDEFEFSSPNLTTPYREIEDVLLEFYTKLDVMEMMLVAEEIQEEIISTGVFMIPEEYKEVSRSDMENAISLLFN